MIYALSRVFEVRNGVYVMSVQLIMYIVCLNGRRFPMDRIATCTMPSYKTMWPKYRYEHFVILGIVYPKVLMDSTVKTTDMQKEKRGVVLEKVEAVKLSFLKW